MSNYCMECNQYTVARNGDVVCRKTNKPVSALGVKPCFELKEVTEDPAKVPSEVQMKTCKVCGRDLPVTEFKTSPFCKDGRTNTCKECSEKHRVEGVKRYHDSHARKADVPEKEPAPSCTASIRSVRVCDECDVVEIVLRAKVVGMPGIPLSAIGRDFTVTFAE